jgi:hypothetical protein
MRGLRGLAGRVRLVVPDLSALSMLLLRMPGCERNVHARPVSPGKQAISIDVIVNAAVHRVGQCARESSNARFVTRRAGAGGRV